MQLECAESVWLEVRQSDCYLPNSQSYNIIA